MIVNLKKKLPSNLEVTSLHTSVMKPLRKSKMHTCPRTTKMNGQIQKN